MPSRTATTLLALASVASCAGPGAATIPTLHAAGPDPSHAQAMQTFGRLVGDWDVVVEFLREDGSWLRAEGEWHFGWILQGRAVQDVWTVYHPGAEQGESKDLLGYGTTIRVYDERSDLWHVNWVGVLNHNYTLFSARSEGAEIVQNAVDDEGDPFQWIFYDIGDGSFRWRAQSLSQGGWVVQQRMTARRRPK